MRLTFERIIAIVCVLSLLVLGVVAANTSSTVVLVPPPLPTVKPNTFIYAYVVPAWEFCISANSIVQSDGSYENNLVGGATDYPIPDTDYMQYPGIQRHICLPGNRYDSYYFLGTSYVGGSGCLKEFSTPEGGRFALLHMDCQYNSLTGPSYAVTDPPTAGPIYSFAEGSKILQDGTYNGVPTQLNRGVALVYHGGRYVGWSRWPSSYAYSFGSCWDDTSCRQDAHLCVVADARALAWFSKVEHGWNHHAPKPTFPAKRWGQHVNAYYRHRLTRTAFFWWHHTTLTTALRQTYHRGKPGYHKTQFAHHAIFCWDNGACRKH